MQSLLRILIGGTGLAILLLVRAATADAAPVPADRFAATARTTTLVSSLPLDRVLACFTATASQPSFAHVARRPDAAQVVLRFDNLVFESFAFAATPTGTSVTVALSPDYDRRELARHVVARGKPLAACLAPIVIAANSPGTGR